VIHPEQRISRGDALKTHTIWAAYLQFADKERGSIEPGKVADLVVIDRDYLTCNEAQIKDIQPVMTVLGGKIEIVRNRSNEDADMGREWGCALAMTLLARRPHVLLLRALSVPGREEMRRLAFLYWEPAYVNT